MEKSTINPLREIDMLTLAWEVENIFDIWVQSLDILTLAYEVENISNF